MQKYKIFLDTNIYDANNYSFENPSLSLLQRYASEDVISLLITSITKIEVEMHIENRLKNAVQEVNNTLATYSAEFASFRYNETYKSRLKDLNPNDMISECIGKFHEFLNVCKTETINSNGIDMEAIIENYKKIDYPFQKSKPDEFKDAIAIYAIAKYFANESLKSNDDIKYYIISADKGFRVALKRLFPESENLLISHDMKDVINLVTYSKQKEALHSFIISNNMEDEIKDKVESFLSSVSYFIDPLSDNLEFLNMINFSYEIEWIDVIDNKNARLSLSLNSDIEVWYSYIDYEHSFFDSEDKRYLWHSEIESQEKHNIQFELTFDLDISCFSDHLNDPTNDGKYSFVFDDDYVEISNTVDLPNEIVLNEDTCLESKIRERTPFYTTSDEKIYAESVCPDCGSPFGLDNDGGNGFCIKCSMNH